MRVAFLAALAMVAFAANSVIARFAISDRKIDPGTFTFIRLLSGAVILLLIVGFYSASGRENWQGMGSWPSAMMLLIYAGAFSYAYLRLGAATGALILFAVVQTVMFAAAIQAGERPGLAGFAGLVLAFVGLVTLVGPGVSRPDPHAAYLMALGGVAWAGYTLRGRTSDRPISVTAGNFIRSVPLALALWIAVLLLNREEVHVGVRGVLLALLSGAMASGLGYALWYTVLPSLTRVQSGIVQMAPAPLATLGGLVLLGEPITARLFLASLLILGGVLLGVLRPRRRA